MVLLFVVMIVVGIAIVSSFFSFRNILPTEFSDVYTKTIRTIGFQSPYNMCEAFSSQKISLQDFESLIQAAYNGQCGKSHANVSLSFSLTKDELQKIAVRDDIALKGQLIFYNITKSLGVGAIIVQGDTGQYPLKFEDFVDIYSDGSPAPDLFMTVKFKGCDPFDDVCDVACIYKGICDPVCDDGQKHNIPCNLACIIGHDVIPYGNNSIDENNSAVRIASGKCNPDCYSNVTNPLKAYDPGCVWQYKNQNDDICDPNSNGVKDGVCDPDCLKSNSICDPDCNGTVYGGNPFGLNDTKCFVCDQTCNGWCSPACNKNAYPGEPGFDPDCYKQVNSSYFCSGDGICESGKGENCANSADCPGGGYTCGDYHAACCPVASDADISGCSNTTNLGEGGSCACGTQCAKGLSCDDTNHCCPDGKKWNGTACTFSKKYKIVFVPIGFSTSESATFHADAQKAIDLFLKLSPFKECSNPQERVEALFIEPGECSMSCTYLDPSPGFVNDCNDQAIDCVQRSKYATTYNKIAALFKAQYMPCDATSGGLCLGAALGIPADSSVTGAQYTNTILHETGHAQGLCHECDPSPTSNPNYCAQIGCPCRGVGADSYCPNSNIGTCSGPGYENNYIMCYGAQTVYSPESYNYLKTNELAPYLQGC